MFGKSRLRRLTYLNVAVHSVDGRTWEGLCAGVYTDALVLKNATYLLDDGRAETLTGDVLIPIGNVSFIQEFAPEPRALVLARQRMLAAAAGGGDV